MNSYKFKLAPRELFFATFIILLPLGLSLSTNLGLYWADYTDELLCVICAMYTTYISFKRGIKGTDFALLVLLIILSTYTLLGNVIYKYIIDWFPVVVDTICLAKMFLTFLIYKLVAEADKERRIIKFLLGISKLILILGAICGLISLFFDIGMTGEKRYGIPSYSFIFYNEGRYGYIVACSLLTILLSNTPKRQEKIYTVFAIFNMILTTKGVVYIIIACWGILSLMWKFQKTSKITLKNWIVLLFGGTLTSLMQIKTYLADSTSPRVRLLKYGIETANDCFPFGSGFATYGSDMAAKNYSVLYTKYGFESYYGLSKTNGSFLNDCYLGMVFGEFGYIGTIIFIVMIVMIYIPLNKITFNKNIKALTMAIFIGLVVSCIGTAIIKSSIGVYVFAHLGLVCGYSNINQIKTKQSPIAVD